MGEKTKIEWCHATFNPWWGCSKVSPGCQNCYAEGFAKRTGNAVWGTDAPRRFFGDKHWAEPLKWDGAAQACGTRPRVFCGSMCDVFEDRDDLYGHRQRLFSLIRETPNLNWLLLTKRPENIRGMIGALPPENVWIGTTVENQEMGEKRIPILMGIPATVRFLSCEPLLEPVDLAYAAFNGADSLGTMPGIDWVICGEESGSRARPMDKSWVIDLWEQCQAARIPFFLKQMKVNGVLEKMPVLAGHVWDEIPNPSKP